MAAAYTVFGKQIPAHILSIATLASVAGIGIWSSMGSKAEPSKVPAAAPVAQSKEADFDLEKFINDLTKEETK
ncbi:uncharacterized protein J8A68_000276 [[Candida] subhashii]|uniref:ATP synthase subunit K, mitochondrial n=1 Tax=[Candida] subhashii TaxID=561895 RepID=A0A8J5QXC9_9ASCO|nr:uncharacterized protein J8A68_000276 [[Candida] subhashii]KAG7666180.1 hypothetical protein J8A68_000276 [[Candida] subhashii]